MNENEFIDAICDIAFRFYITSQEIRGRGRYIAADLHTLQKDLEALCSKNVPVNGHYPKLLSHLKKYPHEYK